MANPVNNVWNSMVLHEFENSADFNKWNNHFSNLIFGKPYSHLTLNEKSTIKSITYASLTSFGKSLGTSSPVDNMNTLYSSLIGAHNGLAISSFGAEGRLLGVNNVIGHSPYAMGAAASLNNLIAGVVQNNKVYGKAPMDQGTFTQFIGEAIRTNTLNFAPSSFATLNMKGNIVDNYNQVQSLTNSSYYVSRDNVRKVAVDAVVRAIAKANEVTLGGPMSDYDKMLIVDDIKALQNSKESLTDFLSSYKGKGKLSDKELDAAVGLANLGGIDRNITFAEVNKALTSIENGDTESILMLNKKASAAVNKAYKDAANLMNDLSKIFDTKDFNVFKEAARNLGITNLTSSNGIRMMKDYLKYASVDSLKNGVTIQESLTHLANSNPAYVNVFGKDYAATPYIMHSSNLAGSIASANGRNPEEAIASTTAMHVNNEQNEVARFAQIRAIASDTGPYSAELRARAKEILALYDKASAPGATLEDAKNLQEALMGQHVIDIINAAGITEGSATYKANIQNLPNSDREILFNIWRNKDLNNIMPSLTTISSDLATAFFGKNATKEQRDSLFKLASSALPLYGMDLSLLKSHASIVRNSSSKTPKELLTLLYGNTPVNEEQGLAFINAVLSGLNDDQIEVLMSSVSTVLKNMGTEGSFTRGSVSEINEKTQYLQQLINSKASKNSPENAQLSSVIARLNENKQTNTGISILKDDSPEAELIDKALANKADISLIELDDSGQLTEEGKKTFNAFVEAETKSLQARIEDYTTKKGELEARLKKETDDKIKGELNKDLAKINEKLANTNSRLEGINDIRGATNFADIAGSARFRNSFIAKDKDSGTKYAALMKGDTLDYNLAEMALYNFSNYNDNNSQLNRVAVQSAGLGADLETFDRLGLEEYILRTAISDDPNKGEKLKSIIANYRDRFGYTKSLDDILRLSVNKPAAQDRIEELREERISMAQNFSNLASFMTVAKEKGYEINYEHDKGMASVTDTDGNALFTIRKEDVVGSLINAYRSTTDEGMKSVLRDMIKASGGAELFNRVEDFDASKNKQTMARVAELGNAFELTDRQLELFNLYAEDDSKGFDPTEGVPLTAEEKEMFNPKKNKKFNNTVFRHLMTHPEDVVKVMNGQAITVENKDVFVERDAFLATLSDVGMQLDNKDSRASIIDPFIKNYNDAQSYMAAFNNANGEQGGQTGANVPASIYMKPLSVIMEALANLTKCIGTGYRLRVTNTF